MEITPTVVISAIGLLIVILGTFAAIVGGFVRIESKSNQNTADINDLYAKVEKHVESRDVHHDGEELDRRFTSIEKGVEEIKGQIKEGIDRLTRRFDDFLSKQK